MYHRKLGPDPGWADREIRWTPLAWDPGYPVVRQSGPDCPLGGPLGPVGTASAPLPGLAGPAAQGLDRAVA